MCNVRGEGRILVLYTGKKLRGIDSLPLFLLSDHQKSDLLMHPGWSLLCFSLLKYVLSLKNLYFVLEYW